MTVREEVHHLVDQLTEAELLMVERLLRGITLTRQGGAAASPDAEEERLALIEEACAVLARVPRQAADRLSREPEDP